MPLTLQIRETVRMSGSRRRAVLAFAVALGGCIAAPILFPVNQAANAFLAECGLLLITLVALGLAMNGRTFGVVVDSRNRVSLAKLQMVAWTVLVVSALAVLGAYRLRYGPAGGAGAGAGPLDITIPPQLLFAMGIAAATVVAGPALLSLKAGEAPSAASVATATAANNGGDPAAFPTNVGKVDARATPEQARLTDVVKGDLVGDMLSVDLSKVQQLAITILLLGLYGGAVYASLAAAENNVILAPNGYLPPLSDALVQLMGISHAGYLLYKAAPRTSSGPSLTLGPAPATNKDPSSGGSLG